MHKYHITWFETADDYRSKGENFEAINETFAIMLFKHKYPNVIFLSCVSMEVLNRKGISEQPTT